MLRVVLIFFWLYTSCAAIVVRAQSTDKDFHLYTKVLNSFFQNIEILSVQIDGSLLDYVLKPGNGGVLLITVPRADSLLKSKEWSFLNRADFNQLRLSNTFVRQEQLHNGLSKRIKKGKLRWHFYFSPVIYSEDRKKAFLIVQTATSSEVLGVEAYFLEFKNSNWVLIKRETLLFA